MNTQKLIGKVEKFVLFGIFNQHYNNKWHYLREMNMLNDEEEKTIEGKTTREDKALKPRLSSLAPRDGNLDADKEESVPHRDG